MPSILWAANLLIIFVSVLKHCDSISTGATLPSLLQKGRRENTINRTKIFGFKNEIKTKQSQHIEIIASEDLISTEKISLNVLELCLCGAFASAFGDFVMHPVDTVKVFQQTSTSAISLLAAWGQVFKKAGILGFYSGVGPYVVADGISGAIKFAVFEVSKKFAESNLPAKFHPISQFVCAAGAMLACSITLVPGEVIKTRLQSGAYGTFSELITSTIQNEGFFGFFTGYAATLIRDVPYTMLELGLYENIKTIIRKLQKRETLSSKEELFAAAITGGITAVLTTPLDLVKTKLMVQSTTGGYVGVWDALQSIYAAGGLSGLFVGATARVAWLLPFTTIYLGVYEVAKREIVKLRKID